MTKDVLKTLLTSAANGAGKGDRFKFDKAARVTLVVAAGGAVLNLEEVEQIELKEGYLAAASARGEIFLCDQQAILGLKMLKGRKRNTGFLP